VACDLLCTSYGLVPNTELARLAGCATDASVVHVDAEQATSVAGLFCAGEPTGIAGVEAAVVEGEIAGLAAAGAFGAATRVGRQLARARDLGRRDADRLARAFGLRTEVRSLARADTIVCRCEDVALGELDAAWSPREAKLATRAGMGACQARVCGPALEVAFGWSADRVRMPVKPVALERLIESEEE